MVAPLLNLYAYPLFEMLRGEPCAEQQWGQLITLVIHLQCSLELPFLNPHSHLVSGDLGSSEEGQITVSPSVTP